MAIGADLTDKPVRYLSGCKERHKEINNLKNRKN
jgi:hypothetical protein